MPMIEPDQLTFALPLLALPLMLLNAVWLAVACLGDADRPARQKLLHASLFAAALPAAAWAAALGGPILASLTALIWQMALAVTFFAGARWESRLAEASIATEAEVSVLV